MKTFKIFQIHLSDAEVDIINHTGDHFAVPKQAAKVGMQLGRADGLVNLARKAFGAGLYDFVATIEANDLDDCFEVGNIGPEENIERFSQMHSISVGDVILDEDGNMWLTATVGFQPVRKLVPDMFFFEDELEGVA